jgi:hypothetical protein
VELKGDGGSREPQGASDEQLRAAQTLLQQTRAGLSGKAQKHVDQAINQISTARKIR